jgi:hypothetical protein
MLLFNTVAVPDRRRSSCSKGGMVDEVGSVPTSSSAGALAPACAAALPVHADCSSISQADTCRNGCMAALGCLAGACWHQSEAGMIAILAGAAERQPQQPHSTQQHNNACMQQCWRQHIHAAQQVSDIQPDADWTCV